MVTLSDILNGVAGAFGARTEPEPRHEVLKRIGDAMEIRRYPVRWAYEVRMDAPDTEEAFGKLFRTIQGANAGGATIPMTAPVERAGGQRIRMTAPVERKAADDGWTMRFFLPDEMQQPPEPTEPGVTLVQAPVQVLGVRRFSGTAGKDRLSMEEGALRDALRLAGWRVTGPRIGWFYDPPWCLPPLRRNEVALEVERVAEAG
ncbi:heme-binding protein [Roseomonas sp. CCTCC AB2023176]|uniref:SOUL family heme-binding protein n=1 Tax=Roseomonas sp. CCTCC AB2023176 TaxID=3342640 RepID=UPI0035D942C8